MVVPAGAGVLLEEFEPPPDEPDDGAGGGVLVPGAEGVAEEVVEAPGAAFGAVTGAVAAAALAGSEAVPPHPPRARTTMANTATIKTKKGTERIFQF